MMLGFLSSTFGVGKENGVADGFLGGRLSTGYEGGWV